MKTSNRSILGRLNIGGGVCITLLAAKEGNLIIMPSVYAILLKNRIYPFGSPGKD